MTEIEDIVKMAVSQKPFFGKRGGVTFSGGEPSMQARELLPLFQRLHEEGINICIDTNGGAWNSDIEELMRQTDLVLLDCKQIDNQKHTSLTGHSNEQTLKTAEWLEKNGKAFWLRYVLVPGISDEEKDIRNWCEHFKGYNMLQRVEILPYHTLGKHKYESMGQMYLLEDTPTNTPEQLERALKIFKEYFDFAIMN